MARRRGRAGWKDRGTVTIGALLTALKVAKLS
jgi:hypothetical protein